MPRQKVKGQPVNGRKRPHDGMELIEFEAPNGDPIIIPKRKRYYFGAVAKAYRLQLVSQSDMKDMRTGQIIQGRNKTAQFENGVYGPVRSFDVAKQIYQTKSFQEGLMWDLDTTAAVARESNYQALKQTVMGNEEDKRRLFEELKAQFTEAAGAN